jgi:L-fuconolactonase
MKIIDTHQHFWNYNAKTHDWINNKMQSIRKNFTPKDLELLLKENKVEGCISVQVDQTYLETEYLLGLANDNPFIKGVVGWADLRDSYLEQALEKYNNIKLLKGFRHIIQAEPKGFMLQPSFKKGLDTLLKYNYTYDLLIYEDQLAEAKQLIIELPELPIVIDHIAKPNIKKGDLTYWKKEITAIAQYPNVYCKLSGMATEAQWDSWTMNTLEPYLDVVVEAFGTERIMYGSDWPVCIVATSYSKWLNGLQNYFNTFSKTEQGDIFANNAIKFYKI